MTKIIQPQNRERGYIEKALDEIPPYKDLCNHHPDLQFGAYRRLKTIEKAYEELEKRGQLVGEGLKRTRYGILNFAADIIESELEGNGLISAIRNEEQCDCLDYQLDGRACLAGVKECVEILEEYLGKLAQ